MHILRCMGSWKILWIVLKVPFEIWHKILNRYSANYALYEVLEI